MHENIAHQTEQLAAKIDARVISIKGSLITAEVQEGVNFSRGEIGYLLHDNGSETEEIMAEIVRIEKNIVYMQVFEETYGLKLNTPIRLTRSNLSAGLLSLEFGPGLLGGRIIDGLGNPLREMEGKFGYQLKRGARMRMLDDTKEWDFIPSAKVGDVVSASDKLGSVKEYMVDHYIMVPYELKGEYQIVEIAKASKKRIDDVVAKVQPVAGGETIDLTMCFPAAIKKQIAFGEMIVPEKQLETRMRTVDFLMPVPLGGTFCIPGPFGAGKTVLQHLLAKNSQVDIVVVAACGERAGEVVEMLVEFPEIKDPRTGGSLMDRTIIICNTSSMPVAAREASVYTATAISEHYRQMGLNVLLLADSTSRWAQALRELSGRMEEIPGEEAFPAYMESLISQFYGRAGTLINKKGEKGSLTIGGTVSPAGGNFQEPVTQGTLKVVDAFLGLSRERSDAAKYPAIHPVESWSTYTGTIHKKEYLDKVRKIILEGVKIEDKLKVMEQSDISDDDFIVYRMYDWFDSVFLQQNAFDEVDASCIAERQQDVMLLIMRVINGKYSFSSKEEISGFFAKLGSLMIDFNTSGYKNADYNRIKKQLEEMIDGQSSATDTEAA